MKSDPHIAQSWKLLYRFGDIADIISQSGDKLRRESVSNAIHYGVGPPAVLKAVGDFYLKKQKENLKINNANSPY